MQTKKDLRRDLADAEKTIEMLRAKLCKGAHQWICTGVADVCGEPFVKSVCIRCGKVEVR